MNIKCGEVTFLLESIDRYYIVEKTIYFSKVYEPEEHIGSFLGLNVTMSGYKWNGLKTIISKQEHDNVHSILKNNPSIKIPRYVKSDKTGEVYKLKECVISDHAMKRSDVWCEERLCLCVQAYGKTHEFLEEMLNTNVRSKYEEISNLLSELEKEKQSKRRREQEEQRLRIEKEQMLRRVKNVINELLLELDGDFSNEDQVLNKYKEEKENELLSYISQYYDKRIALKKAMEFINKEYSKWLDGKWSLVRDNDPAIKDREYVLYREQAKQYLLKKYNIFYDLADNILQELITSIYKEKTNGKEWFIKTIEHLNFSECLNLLRQFQNVFNELSRLNQNETREIGDKSRETIKSCMEFYGNARILIQKKTNELSYNKEKNVYIDENQYNEALLYFYEDKTLEEINEIIKRNTYIQNKNKGNRGEEVVDYALSWLPKQYVNIPQVSVGRYDQKCILLQNLDFRNEKQEFDHIIVGPQGIFLIETKNFAGEITIDEEGNWIRRKEGQGVVGERNPIEQIRRHEKLMQSIASDVNIVSIMCLSHPKVVVNGASNSPVKILKSDLLCEYIENYKVDSMLDEDEIQAVVDKIKSYIV